MNLLMTECVGKRHRFTLKDGSTFKIDPHETKPVPKGSANVSSDIDNGVRLKTVSLQYGGKSVQEPVNTAPPKIVLTNKGGKKLADPEPDSGIEEIKEGE